jgi:hypothetical protein
VLLVQVDAAVKEAQKRLEQHGLADRVRLFVQIKDLEFTYDLDDEASMAQVIQQQTVVVDNDSVVCAVIVYSYC